MTASTDNLLQKVCSCLQDEVRPYLDRLTLAEYSIDGSNEAFTIDDLGNRDSVIIRDGNNVDYAIDNLTNRYDSVGGNTLAYDAAGNLTKDRQGYTYQYDYENRITKIIKSGPTTVAEFAYDALGRRIKKRDSIADTDNIYYYNDNWQILCHYNDAGTPPFWFAYGNYIDEVLIRGTTTGANSFMYYGHDHLYSPVLLTRYTGTPIERYEYDAYGNCQIMDASYNPRSSSLYVNSYYFTGRETDSLDSGNLKIMNYRHRYYDTYTGRFTTHDPMGYVDGVNLYEYANSNPALHADPYGLALLIEDKYIREIDPELVRDFRNRVPDDLKDIPIGRGGRVFPGVSVDRRYEAWVKAAMYGFARDHLIHHDADHWKTLLKNWYFEDEINPFRATGLANPYCKDIATHAGFQALLECWVAKFYGCAKGIRETDTHGHFKIKKSYVWWHYYRPDPRVPGGTAAYTDAMNFLGSYTAYLTAKRTLDPCILSVSVEVKNKTSWESASRTLSTIKEWIGLGFSSHARDAGPYLPSRGGDYDQIYEFVLPSVPVTTSCSLSGR